MEETTERPSVLIFDDGEELHQISEDLSNRLPLVEIVPVSSLEKFRSAIDGRDFDVVIIEQLLKEISGIELIVELRLRDTEPSILVTSRSANQEIISAVYSAGCSRCIIKEGRWLDEMAPAVRHLIRTRKLEKENSRLIAKLTEANCLLSDTNARLTEFSSTVAHDIRGPLGGINMKLEYMCDVYGDDIEDKRFAKLLKGTLDASERLLEVVQAMYEFAKLGAKAVKMDMIDLAQLVNSVIQDLNLQAKSNVEITVKDLPQIWGSPQLLSKVFINLINNAIKYSDKEHIVIEIGSMESTKRSLGKFYDIYVKDNGPGIKKEEQEDLFTMFRRGEGAEKKCEGTGIGLSVVKQIVGMHYGNISVQSDNGTTFTFSLPAEEIKLGV